MSRPDGDTAQSLGITQDGLKVALKIKEHYRKGEPLCMPGEHDRILIPENLMNVDLDLRWFEDPLALAMVASRDPEPPMALAAAARLSPLGRKTMLVSGVVGVVGEATRHPDVKKCVEVVTDNDFSPDAISRVRRHASQVIVHTRRQYTTALRQNLWSLMEGVIAPRRFVREFFELTEAGNMRHDIRKKLVLSLLLSATIRPSIKFLLLENFHRMPEPVRMAIIGAVIKAKPSHHIDIIKNELQWIVSQESSIDSVH